MLCLKFVQAYKRGLISFNQPVADPASVQIDDSDLLLLFPFRWNTEAVANNYTTVQAVVHNYPYLDMPGPSPQMKVAWLYLYYGIHLDVYRGEFFPTFLVIIEWRNLTFSCCLEQVRLLSYSHIHMQVAAKVNCDPSLSGFSSPHSQLTFKWF